MGEKKKITSTVTLVMTTTTTWPDDYPDDMLEEAITYEKFKDRETLCSEVYEYLGMGALGVKASCVVEVSDK